MDFTSPSDRLWLSTPTTRITTRNGLG